MQTKTVLGWNVPLELVVQQAVCSPASVPSKTQAEGVGTGQVHQQNLATGSSV